jgi:hypothetical protein
MTVKELRNELAKYPDDIQVAIAYWDEAVLETPEMGLICKKKNEEGDWVGVEPGIYLVLNN